MTTNGISSPRLRRVAVVGAGALGLSLLAAVGPTSVSLVANAATTASVPPAAGAVVATATTYAVQTASVAQSVPSLQSAAPASARRPVAARPATTAPARVATIAPFRFATKGYNQWWARKIMARAYGWTSAAQFAALVKLWDHESHWNMHAHNNRSGAHGIPQALPGSKMRTAGKDWRTNPVTQIKWGLTYIHHRYGTPARAWAHFLRHGWY